MTALVVVFWVWFFWLVWVKGVSVAVSIDRMNRRLGDLP